MPATRLRPVDAQLLGLEAHPEDPLFSVDDFVRRRTAG